MSRYCCCWSWVLAAGLALAACGAPAGPDRSTPGAGDPAQAEEPNPERPTDYNDENSVGLSDERVNRWRWKGSRKDCFFLVGNRCYTDQQQACADAGCDDGQCKVGSGAPAPVSCKGQ